MAGEARNAGLLNEVRTLFDFGVAGHSSDRQLLDRFLTGGHADAEAAFTLLVERHGPMVWYVCRQVLDDLHDGQDAFQATFLVLLRRAGSIRKRESLASWLFGVAMRIARRARFAAISRRFHERTAAELATSPVAATDGPADRQTALHEEIARLPERYREPIVLCHLEGLSTAVAAQRLGCAQGTILSRLARGRERLRRQIRRRGLAEPTGLLAAPFVPQDAAVSPPESLVKAAVQWAVRGGAGKPASATILTTSVSVLTEATLRTLCMTRMALVAAVLTTAGVVTVLAIPSLRPNLPGSSQAASAGKGVGAIPERLRPIDQKRATSRVLEDAFYRILKRDRTFNDPDWAFVITVRDVQDKTLIDATFKHRVIQGEVNQYDAVIQANRTVLHFDWDAKTIRADVEVAEVQRLVENVDVHFLVKEQVLEMPIPVESRFVRENGSPEMPIRRL
jgi:RNA polymerase sigma factor (sigma-70 family)